MRDTHQESNFTQPTTDNAGFLAALNGASLLVVFAMNFIKVYKLHTTLPRCVDTTLLTYYSSIHFLKMGNTSFLLEQMRGLCFMEQA